MTCVSWNCRGLVAATTFRELNDLIRDHKPAIIFLMQTRAHKERVNRIKRRFRYQHVFCVEAQRISRGLCLLWNDYYEVQIMDSCSNYIHTAVKERRSGIVVEFSFIYGNPPFSSRRNLWPRLAKHKPINNSPWCCIGDFKEMLSSAEKDGLRQVDHVRINKFREFLDETGLMDFNLQGCKFT